MPYIDLKCPRCKFWDLELSYDESFYYCIACIDIHIPVNKIENEEWMAGYITRIEQERTGD